MGKNGSAVVFLEGQFEDNNQLGDIKKSCSILLPPMEGNMTFHSTSIMLQLE